MSVILVQMADPSWTMAALHHACSLARRRQASITLLRLIPVPAMWLGDAYAGLASSLDAYKVVLEYRSTAEDYNVALVVQPMQYVSYKEAILQAAESLDAAVIFATPPVRWPGYRRTLELRTIEKHFALQNRRFYSLDPAPRPQW